MGRRVKQKKLIAGYEVTKFSRSTPPKKIKMKMDDVSILRRDYRD